MEDERLTRPILLAFRDSARTDVLMFTEMSWTSVRKDAIQLFLERRGNESFPYPTRTLEEMGLLRFL